MVKQLDGTAALSSGIGHATAQAAVAHTVAELGRLDTLVNDAGVGLSAPSWMLRSTSGSA